MRTKEEVWEELKSLKTRASEIYQRTREVEKELAEILAEFKVGQRVIQTYGLKAEEYEIFSVRLSGSTQVRYQGKKVLKSGALHKNSQELYGTVKPKEVSE